MVKKITILALALTIYFGLNSCNESSNVNESSSSEETESLTGQSGVQDDESQKDVVKIAVGSKDHSTLVAAVQAAEYVDVLANAGPFTVFAPTNQAFDNLPAGTVEGLLKPEKKADLRNILEYHVYVGVIKTESMKDGQVLNQANLGNVTLGVKDGKYTVNGANIVASIPASNGIVHVIDAVLLPK
ncbi:MAG: fasciclin domain-containing protein [Flavobacteriales bacterium]|nr:fasciclin domain-containing protein [Flavobacteriales bacterium]